MTNYTVTVSRRNGDRYSLTIAADCGVDATSAAVAADPAAVHVMAVTS